jgi:DNA-binding PadR family transcriptional regulator
VSEPTTTGYLILGMLATRDLTAYELTALVAKGLDEVWPRAERQMYNAPKRLVAEGYAQARREATGRRERTVYSITPAGRTALKQWLRTEVHRSSFESEALVRVALADEGELADLRRTLATMADQARASRDLFLRNANYMLDNDGGSYPQRLHLLTLSNRFMMGHFEHIIEWATWALHETETWTDTTSPATLASIRSELESIVNRPSTS